MAGWMQESHNKEACALLYPSPIHSRFGQKENLMANLKIRVFRGSDPAPDTTVTVPGDALQIASKLIPTKAIETLQKEGIDLEEIIRLAANPEAHGILVDIEDHKNHERVVISLE